MAYTNNPLLTGNFDKPENKKQNTNSFNNPLVTGDFSNLQNTQNKNDYNVNGKIYADIMRSYQPDNQPIQSDNDTIGNGLFGHAIDAAQAGFAGTLGGQARFAQEFSPIGKETLGDIADYFDDVARRNTPLEELSGADYVASAIGNAVGSGGATLAETAALAAIGSTVVAPAGISAAIGGVASKLPAVGRVASAISKMTSSPFGKYLAANVAASPFEALSEAGNLITSMREEGYTDDEIKQAALKSAALNTGWLTVANALESGTLGKITGALGSRGAQEGWKAISKNALLGSGSSAISEGVEEYGQNLIGNIAQGTDLNYDEAAEAAKMGAIGGAFLGGLGGGVGTYLNSRKNQQAADNTPTEAAESETQRPDFDNFYSAMTAQESGGDINAVNERTRAYGKLQIMPENWDNWSEEALGYVGDMKDPEVYDKVARHKLKEYYDEYGADGAMVAWYSGPANAERWVDGEETDIYGRSWDAKNGNGDEPSIREYVQSVSGKMGNVSGSRNDNSTAAMAAEANNETQTEVEPVEGEPVQWESQKEKKQGKDQQQAAPAEDAADAQTYSGLKEQDDILDEKVQNIPYEPRRIGNKRFNNEQVIESSRKQQRMNYIQDLVQRQRDIVQNIADAKRQKQLDYEWYLSEYEKNTGATIPTPQRQAIINKALNDNRIKLLTEKAAGGNKSAQQAFTKMSPDVKRALLERQFRDIADLDRENQIASQSQYPENMETTAKNIPTLTTTSQTQPQTQPIIPVQRSKAESVPAGKNNSAPTSSILEIVNRARNNQAAAPKVELLTPGGNVQRVNPYSKGLKQARENMKQKSKAAFIEEVTQYVWKNYANPLKGAKSELKVLKQIYETDILGPVLARMDEGSGNGYTLVPNEQEGKEGRMLRVSNNDQWYQKFRKDYGRAPRKAERLDIAYDIFTGKDSHGLPDWYNDGSPEAIAQFEDNKNTADYMLDTIDAFEEVVKRLTDDPHYGEQYKPTEPAAAENTAAQTAKPEENAEAQTATPAEQQQAQSSDTEPNTVAETAEAKPAEEKQAEEEKQPEETTAQNNADVKSIKLNDEKDTIEIRFNGVPNEEIRKKLKAAGYRWQRYNKFWYAKQTDKAMKLAEELGYKADEKPAAQEAVQATKTQERMETYAQEEKTAQTGTGEVSEGFNQKQQTEQLATKEKTNNTQQKPESQVTEEVSSEVKSSVEEANKKKQIIDEAPPAQYKIVNKHIELRFDGRPSAEARQLMKDVKYRWDSARSMWYAPNSTEALELAKQFSESAVNTAQESTSATQSNEKSGQQSDTNVQEKNAQNKNQRFNMERATNTLDKLIGRKKAQEEKKFVNIFDETELEDEIKKAQAEMSKLSANPMFNPVLMKSLVKIGGIYIQKGVNTFAAWSERMIKAIGIGERVRPFLRAAWDTLRAYPADVKFNDDIMTGVLEYVGAGYDAGKSLEQIQKEFADTYGEEYLPYVAAAYEGVKAYPTDNTLENQNAKEVQLNKENKTEGEKTDVIYDSAKRTENDNGSREAGNEIRETASSAQSDRSNGEGMRQAGTEKNQSVSDNGLPGSGPAAGGTSSVRTGKNDVSDVSRSDTGSNKLSASVVDSYSERPVINTAAAAATVKTPSERQTDESNKETAVKVTKEANQAKGKLLDKVTKEMPFLTTGQAQDVVFVENSLINEKNNGVMLTNGTGTGKTYSGLGVIKRYVEQGKKNILIVTPSVKINEQWIAAANRSFGVNVTALDGIKDAGRGVTITTYANLQSNDEILKRDWDLIVTDESHNLMNNEAGSETGYIRKLRALTYNKQGLFARADILYATEEERNAKAELEDIRSQINKLEKEKEPVPDELANKLRDAENKYNALRQQSYPQKQEAVEQWQKIPEEEKPKVLFLSATPFAYVKDIDYAEGYLFHYDNPKSSGYNVPNGRQQFFMEHFGFTMRYNKLTQPDAKIDNGVMEVNFHEWLRKKGVLSGRQLEIDKDYNRGFLLVNQGIGKNIDEGFSWLLHNSKYRLLYDVLSKQFNSRNRNYLIESIKARESIPIIQEYLKNGKKVVIFHDTKKLRKLQHPFHLPSEQVKGVDMYTTQKIKEQWEAFAKARPDLVKLDLSGLESPISIYQKAFGTDIMMFNGDVPTKTRSANVDKFNDDNSGKNLILVQADAGNAGVNLHDTTGKHQRVLINIGIPKRPIYAMQIEGRIYRQGSKSNAIIRYLSTGTNIEKYLFASTIASRASTAENLAMGNMARALRDSFISAFEETMDGTWEQRRPGAEGEDVGGKEADVAVHNSLNDYDRAKSFYYAQAKKTSKNKAKEGVDYYATPEPVGFKMVEWAGLKDGDRVLEPSAGHGAISRFFSPNTENVIIEPSEQLAPLAQMNTDNARLLPMQFENFNIINKFDAVVMNPPYGTAGKTAMEHVAKAFKHLHDKGRVLAIVPNGPSMQKRLDAWFESEEAANAYLVGEVILPGVTFKRAGTGVNTKIIILDKYTSKDRLNVPVKRVDLSFAKSPEELFDAMENLSMPERLTNIMPTRTGQAVQTENTQKSSEPVARVYNPAPMAVQNTEIINTAAEVETVSAADYFNDEEYVHTKTGETFYKSVMKDRVDREQYNYLNNLAKENNGYYSKYAKGFLFNDKTDRDYFSEAGAKYLKSLSDKKYSAAYHTEEYQRSYDNVVEEIRTAFPGAELQTEGNGINVTLPNGKRIRVDIEKNIIVNNDEAQNAMKSHNISGSEAIIEGYWRKITQNGLDGIIGVSLQSREGTAYHEVLHAAMDMALTPKEKLALTKHYEKEAKRAGIDIEEAIADGYRDWVAARSRGQATIFGKLFNKLKDVFYKLKDILSGTESAHNVFRRLESGEVWTRPAEPSTDKQSTKYSADYSYDEMLEPHNIETVNETEPAKVKVLVKSYEEKGYKGRPIVVMDNANEGYIGLTGSHRIDAARKADIEIPAVIIPNNDETARLLDVRDDDELAATAKELYEEGEISQSAYNLLAEEADHWDDVKYSARALNPELKTGTQRAAAVITNTERRGSIQTAKDWIADKKKNFYRDWIDKNDSLHDLDEAFSMGLGRKITDDESIYNKVQTLPANAAGMTHALVEGDINDLNAVNTMLKNKKLKHKVTLAMVLKQIDRKTMDKQHPQYLKESGFKNWIDAFGGFLGWQRLKEMYDLSKARGIEYKLPQGLKIDDLEEAIRKAPPEFKRAAEMYYKFNDNVLTVLEDAGVISAEVHNILNTKYKKYCPLMRDFSDTAAADMFIGGLSNGGRGIANVSIPLKKISIEGSGRAVLNPLESTIKAVTVAVNRAERNKVGLMAVDMAQNSKLDNVIVKVKGTQSDPKNCIFTVLRNGKKEAYQTTQDLYSPIVGYNLPASGLVLGMLRTAAMTLRTGVTTSPSFVVRNFIRDTIFAGVSSKNGFVPLIDSIRGAYYLLKNSKMRAEFEAAGVNQFNFYGSPEAISKSLDDMAGGKAFRDYGVGDIFRALMRYPEMVSGFIESSTRMGEFARARKKGVSIEEAARAARELTLDFSRSGVSGEKVNQAISFFNACLQGGDKLYRLMKQDPLGTTVKLTKYIILPSLMLYAMNYDEDWYKELDPKIKTENWCLNKNIRIPKPQEVGILFGSGVEAMIEQAMGRDKAAVENWLTSFRDTMTPNFLPTLFLPIIEWQANYSTFRQGELVPKRLQNLPDELQYTDTTSELSKGLGKLAGVSPVKLDNVVRGYTGTMGMFLWQSPDYLFEAKQNRPAKKLSERQFIRDFAINSYNLRRSVDEYYDVLEAAKKQKAGYGLKGRQIAAYAQISAANKMITKLNRQVKEIESRRNITPEKKRELIDAKRDKIKALATKVINKYGNMFDE